MDATTRRLPTRHRHQGSGYPQKIITRVGYRQSRDKLQPDTISKAAATLAQLFGSSPAVSPGLSWWSGKAQLIYHGGYPCPLRVSKALNRQRQTRVRGKAEVLGDSRGHAQTAAGVRQP